LNAKLQLYNDLLIGEIVSACNFVTPANMHIGHKSCRRKIKG